MKSTQILLSVHVNIYCVSSNVRDDPGSGFTKLCWMMKTLFFCGLSELLMRSYLILIISCVCMYDGVEFFLCLHTINPT